MHNELTNYQFAIFEAAIFKLAIVKLNNYQSLRNVRQKIETASQIRLRETQKTEKIETRAMRRNLVRVLHVGRETKLTTSGEK